MRAVEPAGISRDSRSIDAGPSLKKAAEGYASGVAGPSPHPSTRAGTGERDMKAEGRRVESCGIPAVSAATPVPAKLYPVLVEGLIRGEYPRRCGTLEAMLFSLAINHPRAKELWQEYLEKYPEAKLEGSDGR